MGDYLSTPCPSAPPRALGGRHLPRGPGHLQAAPCHRRLPLAGPGHPALHQLLAARRPAYRCPVTLHRRLVTVLHRRCSLLPRTLRSFLGVLISTCSRVRRRRAVLRAQTSTLSCSSASPVGTAPVCAAQEQPRTPVLPTTPGCALGSCAEAVSRAPGESGEGLAKQGEDPAVPEGEDQRSPDGTGGEEPEMRHLWVQRGPISFIPRPGSLQRNLRAKNSEDRCVQKPQTSCVSSCPRRNVISSSYSSSRGSPPVRRKRGPAHSELPPKSLKKGRKESPRPPAAALVVSPWTNWPDRDADTVRGPRGTKGNTSDGPRPRRCRFSLLPHRRGEPLRLPPPPELGFRVTGEDLNMEKKAAFRQINSMLRGETEAGLAPPPSPDAEVTSMGTTPPSQPLLSGAPQTTSGSILPPLQTPQTAPMGALAFDTPAQETGVTPINNTAPSQPLLSGAPQTTSGSILPPLQAPQTAPSGGLAFFTPACDSGVTPMDSTPPSQPLLLGAPQTTSGSILPPLQAPQTAPSGALAFVTPAQGTGVTPMNSTVSSQPLLSGAPETTSGNILPPLQAPQTAPHDGVALIILTTSLSALSFCGPNLTVTLPANPGTSTQPILAVPHGQQCGATTACDSSSQYRKQAAPAPTSDSLSAPGLLAFRPPPKASSDGLSSRNPTMGTHASTQPISSATSTVFPHGSAAAAYMPSVVTRAGPNAWRHCPRSASSSPVPCRFGVSATCKGGRSQMGDLELCRLFAALSITGEAKRSPSTTRCRGGRRGLNTWGPVHQSTPMLATGPSTKQQPGFGGTAAPILSPTPGGAPRQSPSASSRGPGTSHSKAGMSVLACGSSPACAAGTGMSSHTVRARSSPVQGVAAHKAAGPSNKSSSSRLGSPPLESKRQMMA
ncbi:putative POM121-like protein 1 [Camelus dromedarius]|uniref:Putative POM121-like protein 1 n=1 Tax=Camelus dromedarius TaxID=9838 RepID=A0A5N4CAX0_CAMDR|nr:nuclear envelope pore membrane protein POM 121C-like [Camelus dromedarius]KAB1256065.1 putative POM121-like protein 1 [Camelus dromedarius]